jgi:hypothetical protein
MSDVHAQASKAMIEGDATAAMQAEVDTYVEPIAAPAAPSTLAVAVISTTQLNLSWKDMSSNEQGFIVERCAGSTCTNFAEVARAGAGATSYANTGLVKATTYRYRVRAFNPGGASAYTATVNGITKSR